MTLHLFSRIEIYIYVYMVFVKAITYATPHLVEPMSQYTVDLKT